MSDKTTDDADGGLLLNKFRYSGASVCRAIPSAIQQHIEQIEKDAYHKGLNDAKQTN